MKKLNLPEYLKPGKLCNKKQIFTYYKFQPNYGRRYISGRNSLLSTNHNRYYLFVYCTFI